MAEPTTDSLGATTLAAELNDLLRLDRDALDAYRAARERVHAAQLVDAVDRFIDDHERHADELTRLVRAYGQRAVELPEVARGPFLEAVLAAGAAAGDRGVLTAVKACERRSRDRFRAAAQRAYPPEVSAVLRRAANDESAHYAWALEALDDLGPGGSRVARQVERIIEATNARAADAIAATERRLGAAADRVSRGLRGELGTHPLRAALVALAAGLAAAAVVGGSRAAPYAARPLPGD